MGLLELLSLTAGLLTAGLATGGLTAAGVAAAGELMAGASAGDFAVVSSDGRFIMFRSKATDLAPGSYSPYSENLFLRDLALSGMDPPENLGGASRAGRETHPASGSLNEG